MYRPGQFYFISCLEQGLCKETIYLFIIVVDYALRTALDVYGRVQAEGDNFCDLKILCIYFFNVKLGLVGLVYLVLWLTYEFFLPWTKIRINLAFVVYKLHAVEVRNQN